MIESVLEPLVVEREFASPLATLRGGRISLGAAPGLGIEPDLVALRAMREAADAAATP